jgi:hypothetical protein
MNGSRRGWLCQANASAYDKLTAVADRERARFPFLTKKLAFSRVYENNPKLAAAERRESSAATQAAQFTPLAWWYFRRHKVVGAAVGQAQVPK